jgi:glycosyltransferase involved in cell wall biosynthesis
MRLPRSGVSFNLLTASNPNDPDLPIDSRVALTTLAMGRNKLTRQVQRRGAGLALGQMHDVKALDIVHLHGLWLDIGRDAAKWARKQGVTFVASPHGMLEPWAMNHKKWKKDLAMMLFQRGDLEGARAFHACSELEAESIRRLGFKQPIAVIPNGVMLPELPTEKLKTNKPVTERKTALFLSRINPKKGLPMLLDAWKQLAPQDWRLVIAGNDDSNHTPLLERKIRELNLSDSVEIVGPLFGEAKEAAFRNADLFLLPSFSENFGIVVTEALGYQVPVLTTTGCPWDELESERCGWWVEPTPAGIEKGLIAALSTSNAELCQMGIRGRALVERKYQWPAIADGFVAFYAWLLGRGEKPDFIV